MRQGIMHVSSALTGRARMALPPEHRVAAVRPGDFEGDEVWLIEGSHMPEVSAGGQPETVKLLLSLSHPPDSPEGPVTLTGCWTGPTWVQTPEWICGVWPDFETFRAAFDG